MTYLARKNLAASGFACVARRACTSHGRCLCYPKIKAMAPIGKERILTFTTAVITTGRRAILAGLLLLRRVAVMEVVQLLSIDRSRSRLLCRCAGLAECRHGEEMGGQGPLMERGEK